MSAQQTVRRLASLRPIDVVLASTRIYSSLPLVGRHLEPFAGLTAMTMYGGHYAPAAAQPGGSRIPPFARARAQRRRCLYRSSVRYGGHPEQLLDV